MAETKVIMPQMGESIFEGTLTKWLKKAGDPVKRDEPLFEISTDKIDSEIPAPASGILQRILVQEGQTVEINTVVGIIGDERVTEEKPKEQSPAVTPQPATPPPETVRERAREEDETAPGHVSPVVRKLAREHGVDLAVLAGKGTGIGGRITKNDILHFVEERKSAPAAATSQADVDRAPMSAMRKAIAEHMVMSQRTSAHVTTFFEIDCSAILAAREKLKAEFAKLTVTPFFVYAAVQALKRFPVINASVEGNTIVYKKRVHVGIAVNIEGGLIVPVIRNADEKNLLQLAQTINDLGERARSKQLTPDEVQGGTFSVTNPGQFGAVIGTPIINQPQVAILCMGGIKKRAVVVENDAIVARPMIMLSLSFDHRIIDGAVADQFMADIQKQLENWQG